MEGNLLVIFFKGLKSSKFKLQECFLLSKLAFTFIVNFEHPLLKRTFETINTTSFRIFLKGYEIWVTIRFFFLRICECSKF